MHISDTKTYPIIPQREGQDLFCEKMKEACQHVEVFIRNGCCFSILIDVAGIERGIIAEKLKCENADKFGKPRKEPHHRISTDLAGVYQSMSKNLKALSQIEPTIKWDTYASYLHSGYRLESNVSLTRYIYNPFGKSTLAHTYPENIEAAKNVMEEIYLSDEPPLSKIARLHWWLVNTTPFFRGSASCGELIASALHHHHFGTYICWKKGKIPDFIALVTSSDAFVNLYPSLFEPYTSSEKKD